VRDFFPFFGSSYSLLRLFSFFSLLSPLCPSLGYMTGTPSLLFLLSPFSLPSSLSPSLGYRTGTGKGYFLSPIPSCGPLLSPLLSSLLSPRLFCACLSPPLWVPRAVAGVSRGTGEPSVLSRKSRKHLEAR
jgi:hypothetical protein